MRCGKIIAGLLMLFVLFSCTTTPEQDIQPPDWFLNPPADTDLYKYFTINEKSSLLQDIENLAGIRLYEKVANALSLSREEAEKDDLSEIREEIISVVSGGKSDGINLLEKQKTEKGTEKVIFVLVRMEKKRLAELTDQLKDILRAGSSASLYTVEAEELVGKGKVYEGALAYIRAALDSAGSNNTFITEQNLKAAIALFEKMAMRKGDAPETISVGEKGIFTAILEYDSGLDDIMWDGTSVKVIFRDRKKKAVIGDRFAQLRSDKNGVISFVHPSPGFTGAGKVEISLDILRDTGDLALIEEKFPEEYNRLIAIVNKIRIQYNFEIVSSAPSVPTAVFIADSDFLRKPLQTRQTGQGLVSSLKAVGFNTDLSENDIKPLFELSDDELLRDLPVLVDQNFRRVAFGVAQIIEFDDAAAGFTVVTEARIRVLDLESGEILFDEKLNKRVQGGESQATINTSFKELGKSFSSLLMDKLP